MRLLRTVPQHRQEIQADQMRDPPLIRAGPLVAQLTTKHPRRHQCRREAALGHLIPPEDRPLAKQIAGLPGSVYATRHIAPRILLTRYSTSPVIISFHFASQAVLRSRKWRENFCRGSSSPCRISRRHYSACCFLLKSFNKISYVSASIWSISRSVNTSKSCVLAGPIAGQ